MKPKGKIDWVKGEVSKESKEEGVAGVEVGYAEDRLAFELHWLDDSVFYLREWNPEKYSLIGVFRTKPSARAFAESRIAQIYMLHTKEVPLVIPQKASEEQSLPPG